VEVESGKVLASQRITGDPGEKIFSIVDRLTVEVKKGLSLPAQAQKEEITKVADVTTHSPEAYRYYLEGLDYLWKAYDTEAERSFKKALEYDSTFAMAYFWLAQVQVGQTAKERKELVAKAVKYSDKVSQKEKYYIKILEAGTSGNQAQAIKELQKMIERYPQEKIALFALGASYYDLRQTEEAVRTLTKAVEIDPLFKMAYNLLAYAYNDMGDFEKSIWAINKYISLAPDEANPYDSRADLYSYNGRLDQAIESYRKALEIKPDFYMSLAKLGGMYLFKREYTQAESCFKALSSSNEKLYRSLGRVLLALIPLYRGKFEDALKVLDDGIAADRMEQAEGVRNATKHFFKAQIYEEKKNMDLALKEAEMGIEILKKATPSDPVTMRDYYTNLLAKSGKIAEAEKVALALKKDIEEKNKTLMYSYWLALGAIELAKGDTNTAINYLEKADKEALSPLFHVRFFLGKTYLESGKIGEAVAELEKALSRYDDYRVGAPAWAVKAYYLLGLAYEKSGWKAKAIEQYEEFLDIWKNADPGIPEVQDAKERVKKLRVES
jgi:tetratricopeptide (TPR) repeat protein